MEAMPDFKRKEANERALKNIRFEEIAKQDIPANVLEEFVDYAKRDQAPDAHVDFSQFLVVKHGDGDSTYVTFERREDEFGLRDFAYLVDYLDGKIIGEGKAIRDLWEGGHAYVGHTLTKQHLQEGFGERRVAMMGVLSARYWNSALRSSDQIRAAARKVWQKLAKKGLAEPLEDDPDAFRFVSQREDGSGARLQ